MDVLVRSSLASEDCDCLLLEGLFALLKQVGKYAEGEAVAVRMYSLLRGSSLGVAADADPMRLIEASTNVGAILQMQGKHREALPYCEECLEISLRTLADASASSSTSTSSSSSASASLVTASAYNNLASVLHKLGGEDKRNLDKAYSHLKTSLSILESKYGSGHLLTGATLNNLGALLQDMENRRDEALECLERSLSVFVSTKAIGENNKSTATTCFNIGALHRKMMNMSMAKKYFERCCEIRKRVLGRDHADTRKAKDTLCSIQAAIDDMAAVAADTRKALDALFF